MILFVANLYCEIYCNDEQGVLHVVDATTAYKIKDEIDWCDLQWILQYPLREVSHFFLGKSWGELTQYTKSLSKFSKTKFALDQVGKSQVSPTKK